MPALRSAQHRGLIPKQLSDMHGHICMLVSMMARRAQHAHSVTCTQKAGTGSWIGMGCAWHAVAMQWPPCIRPEKSLFVSAMILAHSRPQLIDMHGWSPCMQRNACRSGDLQSAASQSTRPERTPPSCG